MSQYKITAVCTLGITKDEAQEIAKGIELFSGVKYALSEEIRPTPVAADLAYCPSCKSILSSTGQCLNGDCPA